MKTRLKRIVPRVCETCGADFLTRPIDVQRGNGRFCTQRCFGVTRRLRPDQTMAERLASPEFKQSKAEYDRQYRAKNRERLLTQKREAYKRDHEKWLAYNRERRAEIYADPERLARYREEMKRYRENPDWQAHKRQYDRKYRAEAVFGPEYADAAVLLWELEEEIAASCPDRVDIYTTNGTLNKSQTRKRNACSETQRRRAQG